MRGKIIIESNAKILAYKRINKKKYARPGIWALHGQLDSGGWKCLEVSQTTNVYRDIKRAIYMLTTPDDKKCERHVRFLYGIKFQKENLTRVHKYRSIIKPNYQKFRFVCVNISDSMRDLDERLDVEEEYAVVQNTSAWFDW